MGDNWRRSRASVETRVTKSGRKLAAAVFPSDRLALKDDRTLVLYESVAACPADRLDRKPPNCRPGVLYRKEDESGVSGTGVVADFVCFPDGSIVQEWRNEENPNLDTKGPESSGLDYRPSMDMAIQIHGHNGRTEYVYDNGEVVNA